MSSLSLALLSLMLARWKNALSSFMPIDTGCSKDLHIKTE